MKKIIFFSKDLSIGGMEKSLLNLLNELSKYYEITLVLENISGEYIKYLNEKIILKKYNLSNNKVIIIRKIINLLNRIIWKIKYLNRYDFSCNYATYLVWASKLAKISSNNSAYYIHSNYYEAFKHDKEKFINFFSEHQIEKFKNIIFVSNESRDAFLKAIPNVNKTVVINNIIDYKNILSLANKEKIEIDKNKINYLYIGRLDNESKNIKLLLESFLLVFQKNPNIVLTIIGDGSYQKNLIRFIKDNKMEKYVNYLGSKVNPYPYLKASDALILTSNYEGFPVVYLEALVLNKPILTTIITSDNEIDISDYCIHLEKDKNKIAREILKQTKKDVQYDLDFDKINIKRINSLRNIIEEQ